MSRHGLWFNVFVAMASLGFAATSFGQPVPGQGGPGGFGGQGGFGQGGFGQGGQGGPNGAGINLQAVQQQVQQTAMDNLRQRLGATDDEFAALQPLITRVIADDQAVNVGSSATAGRQGMGAIIRQAIAANGGGGPNGGPGGQGGFGGNGGPGGGFAGNNGGNGQGQNPNAQGNGNRGGFRALMQSPYGVPPNDLQNQLQAALDALNAALDDPNAVPDSVQTKMDAYRNLKLRADEQLDKDAMALKQVLTTKQEGTLLAMGLVN